MGLVRGSYRFARSKGVVRAALIAAAALVLANCSGGLGSVDPKYGVSASKRVVEPGQPVPKGGGVYRVGKPYVVAGRTYVPEENANYSETGVASWYGDDFHGRYTANGEIFDMNSISAAHRTMPLPSYARVTNLKNHKSIIVRVNDRGPYANDRVIDLSVRTAKLLDFYGHGLARVKVEYVGRAPLTGSDDRKLLATLRDRDVPGKEKAHEIQVAAAGNFAPAYFDKTPMSKDGAFRSVPAPRDRPYAAEDAADATEPAPVEVAEAPRAPTFDQRFPKGIQRASLEAPPSTGQGARLTSPVSAYAPARYDASAGFMSGRGLY
jgi:rare lipoprotein A